MICSKSINTNTKKHRTFDTVKTHPVEIASGRSAVAQI